MEQAGREFDSFAFSGAEIRGRLVRLEYALRGARPSVAFTEEFTLPAELPAPDPASPAIRRALEHLHLMAGLSYWKTFCPHDLDLGTVRLTPDEALFWTTMYTQGMSEFLYRNDVDPTDLVEFPSRAAASDRLPVSPAPPTASNGDAQNRVLLLVGGGKDSVVAREVLRHSNVDVDLFSVGTHRWLARSAQAMGDRHLVVRRTIDRQLLALNEAGALNGHVPVSAIIACVAHLVALTGGYRAVIAANESTASIGNTTWKGLDVNHQYSKSVQFERLYRRFTEHAFADNPRYFSILRPLSELAIARLFSRHDEYFPHVTSCNRNFAVGATDATPRWCGQCAKCIFVAIITLPFLNADQAQALFGRNLLDSPDALPHLRALVGVEGLKPFDCVGTPDEVVAGLWLLSENPQWRDALAVRYYRDELAPQFPDPQGAYARCLKWSDDHELSPAWMKVLRDYTDSRSV